VGFFQSNPFVNSQIYKQQKEEKTTTKKKKLGSKLRIKIEDSSDENESDDGDGDDDMKNDNEEDLERIVLNKLEMGGSNIFKIIRKDINSSISESLLPKK